jgi:hypothetical protein
MSPVGAARNSRTLTFTTAKSEILNGWLLSALQVCKHHQHPDSALARDPDQSSAFLFWPAGQLGSFACRAGYMTLQVPSGMAKQSFSWIFKMVAIL